ncbi:MAG: ABC transporter permease [Verrucomicrobia bacterium]|nr:ABC transporter permease [Verrucomicrobiota bacterium]
MFSALQDVVRHRELLWILVGRNLKIRYKNSALGFFWSLLAPLFMIGIYTVFLKLMKFSMNLPMLVTGIIAWQFAAMSLGDSLHAIVGNANLVTKSAFPRIILPLSMVLANVVNFLLSCIVLIVYLVVERADLSHAAWFPVVLIVHVSLVTGVALLFSTANVFFRDTEHLVSMILLAWFFLTPVIYPDALVLENPAFPAAVQALFFANPMTGVITGYRMALLGWAGPGTAYLLLSVVASLSILLLGLFVFLCCQDRFGDEL